jgi:hypothetical protein
MTMVENETETHFLKYFFVWFEFPGTVILMTLYASLLALSASTQAYVALRQTLLSITIFSLESGITV